MSGQWCHRHRHVWEQRELAQQFMQRIVIFDVEDAVVGVCADDAPEMTPPFFALQLLRIGLLFRLDSRGFFRRDRAWNVDNHVHQIKHGISLHQPA